MSDSDRPAIGLRERKKAKTRAAIQKEALRLFKEQGYEATTIEQIAVAAEVSPSTFFRYFPTKEDVVLYDVLDPFLLKAFRTQPANLSPIQALRAAFHKVFDRLSAEDRAIQEERAELIFATQELRARMLDDLSTTIQQISEIIAARAGRSADELAVRTYAGVILGVTISAWLTSADDPQTDMLTKLDAALAYLESGMPL